VTLQIRPFCPADQLAVQQLVLAGLVDHWGALDASLNPDLNDIAGSYAAGLFLLGLLGDYLVATGAYLPVAGRFAEAPTCQVMRMSVARDFRRQGLGRQMLAELLQQARAAGFRRVVLETTETWEDVIRFYLTNGFCITHHQDGNVYFLKEI
jgi:putative acetyltransferase